MLFTDALNELKAGKYMRRTNWTREEGYIVFMPGMIHAWKIIPHPNPNAGNHIFSVEEMTASDWEVIDPVFFSVHEVAKAAPVAEVDAA